MSFFISDALAEGGAVAAQQPGLLPTPLSSWLTSWGISVVSRAADQKESGHYWSRMGVEGMLFPLAILVFFYVLFLRPQAKRAKEKKQMVEALAKGTEVARQSHEASPWQKG